MEPSQFEKDYALRFLDQYIWQFHHDHDQNY